MSFRPSVPDDLPALREFLARAFGEDSSAGFLDPRAMSWKYWEPRGDWSEPRSYVIEKAGTIVAHAGLWPVTFGEGAQAVRGLQMIDWASDRSQPGAGLSLVQRLAAMFDFVYSIGGSEPTQKILPAFGFRVITRHWRAVRPLRPLAQAFTHQNRSWKLAPRLARNWAWSLPRSRPGVGRWRAEPLEPAMAGSGAGRAGASPVLVSQRGPAYFDYLLRCPIAPFHLFRLVGDGAARGRLAVSLIRGQARVAGLWLDDPAADQWAPALAAARRAMARIEGVNEIVLIGCGDAVRDAAERAGFHTMEGKPVFLLDRKGRAPITPDFQFQLGDYDGAFLDGGGATYWS